MKIESPSVLVFGQIMRDYIITPQKKVFADQPGGNILYAAEGVKVWQEKNSKIGLISRVGKDFNPEWIESIESKGYFIEGITHMDEEIDLRYFRGYSDLRTYSTIDPIKHFSLEKFKFPKSLLGFKGSNKSQDGNSTRSQLSIRPEDIPENFLSAKYAHLCPMDLETHSLLPANLRGSGVNKISLDPGSAYMIPNKFNDLAPMINGLTAFIPSSEELRNSFKYRTEDIWEMGEEVASWGCDYVVITMGEEGQCLYDGITNRKYKIPAFPSKMYDITGAGDIFSGGFLAGLQITNDPLIAVLYGNIAASIAVEGSGIFYTRGVLKELLSARVNYLKEKVKEI
jgi:hypothetical protein